MLGLGANAGSLQKCAATCPTGIGGGVPTPGGIGALHARRLGAGGTARRLFGSGDLKTNCRGVRGSNPADLDPRAEARAIACRQCVV